ncbi:MAG: oligosaccharide flippase family protein [Actinomycetota bacterium]|nr:oligosaccharide flippase family protein [Actinomycetota bacterium]
MTGLARSSPLQRPRVAHGPGCAGPGASVPSLFRFLAPERDGLATHHDHPVDTVPEDLPLPTGAPPPLSLRSNFSWTAAGNGTYALCQWLTLVVLAQLGSPSMVGRYALGLALSTPIMTLAMMSLRQVLATDARNQFDFFEYVDLRGVTTALGLVVVGIAVVALGYDTGTALVVCAVALSKAFDAVSDILWGLLQKRERMDTIAKSLIIRNVLSVIVLGALVAATGSLLTGVIGSALCSALVLVTYDQWVVRSAVAGSEDVRSPRAIVWHPRLTGNDAGRERLVRLARLALPLGLSTTLISLHANIPRVFLERSTGARELGLFSAMAYITIAGTTLVAALGQAGIPRMAADVARGDWTAFNRLLVKMLAVAAALGIAGILGAALVGRRILFVLYGSDYARQSDMFVWVMVAAAVHYLAVILGHAITATRAFGRFLLPYVMVTVVAIAASAALIPRFGIAGATATLCVIAVASCLAPLGILRMAKAAAS